MTHPPERSVAPSYDDAALSATTLVLASSGSGVSACASASVRLLDRPAMVSSSLLFVARTTVYAYDSFGSPQRSRSPMYSPCLRG